MVTSVKERFKQAAPTYHAASGIQREMARKLIELLPQLPPPASILELGCGTGHLTQALAKALPASLLHVSDVSEAMLFQCRQNLKSPATPAKIQFSKIDASLPWGGLSGFQMVASNALIQWMPNLESHFQAVANSLAEGGYYLVSGFSSHNFWELKLSLKTLLHKTPRTFGISEKDLESRAQESGLSLKEFYQENWQLKYPSFWDFLKELKNMGANFPLISKISLGELKKLGTHYHRNHSSSEGVLVTWSPWFSLLKKAPPA